MRKDASPDELVNTIQNVYLKRVSLPEEIARLLIQPPQSPVEKSSAKELTGREVDVLRCVAEGLSNKQIALKLSVSTTTVRTHVSNLLSKLNLENRTQLALYARQQKIG